MRRMSALLRVVGLLACVQTAPVRAADTHVAGQFDYYLLALSWSPSWCARVGKARQSPQCAADHGWILHGLWPQYTQGYPRNCASVQMPPTRAMTGAMADIMGTSGLAWHQWEKHGTCTNLTAASYFKVSRQAFDAIKLPVISAPAGAAPRIDAARIEDAFIRTNPALSEDKITITCKAGHIQEARICLSKSLEPIPCAADVARDCTARDALFLPR